jgi:hypothetical protein
MGPQGGFHQAIASHFALNGGLHGTAIFLFFLAATRAVARLIGMLTRLDIAFCAACLATTGAMGAEKAAGDDAAAFTIGKNPAYSATDYASVSDLCKALSAPSKSDDKARLEAIGKLSRDKVKIAEPLLACLSAKTTADKDVRLGALKAIEALKPTDQKFSYSLGAAATSDAAEEVRKSAVSLIKSRGDDLAIRTMLGHLMSAFDPLGNVRDQSLHDAAVDSLRGLNDKRVYQALLYHVWMELRLTNISEGSLTTRQIDTFSANNNNNFARPVQLALPIQTPELNMTRVQTSVIAPATSALRSVTGQDFGQDWEKWDRWVSKQK